MSDIIILDRAALRTIILNAVEGALDEVDAFSISLPLPGEQPKTPPRPAEDPTPAPESRASYTIGRGKDNHGYSDVIWLEMTDNVIDIDDAMGIIDATVEKVAGRARDSLRRAMDSDPRFERVHSAKSPTWRKKNSPDPELEL